MIYHPTYIEVRAVRLIGGKPMKDIAKLDQTLADVKDVNPTAIDKAYYSKRRIYRAAVKTAINQGYEL
jgi:hypothetical protein